MNKCICATTGCLTDDKKLWKQLLAALRETQPYLFSSGRGRRHPLAGHCAHAAEALQELIGGHHVRGLYRGPITFQGPDGPYWTFAEEYCELRMHRHSWVELDGQIIDPTWWAFEGKPVGIYRFGTNDPRYLEDAALRRKYNI